MTGAAFGVGAILVVHSLVSSGGEPRETPGGGRTRSLPDPDGGALPPVESPDPVPDRRGTSLLDRATWTTDSATYLPLGRPWGRWALEPGAGRLPVPSPDPESPPVRLALPAGLVAGRCLHADVSAAGRTRVSVSRSAGHRDEVVVASGRSTLALGCAPAAGAHELYRVRMRWDASVEVRVHGVWVGEPHGTAAPAGPVECASAEGWRLRPGEELGFVLMARPGDAVRAAIEGAGAGDVSVALCTDPDARRPLDLERTASDDPSLATLEARLGVTQPRPARVAVSLDAAAGGPACVRRVEVVGARPRALIDGEPPAVQGVVVVLVDTLRADVLDVLDAAGGVPTPELSRFAGQSVVFPRAVSHSNYTKPSVGTLLSGVYPHVHDALPPMARLRPSVTLITERLREAGVQTVGLMSNHFLNNRKFGFWKGWDVKRHVNSYTACLGGEPVADELETMIGRLDTEGPFFLYVHLMDPHSPYSPPPSFQETYVGRRVVSGRILPAKTSIFIRRVRRGDEPAPDEEELGVLEGLYRGDVAHMDVVLGRVLETLQREGVLDRSMVVVTSDHGEEFMEHGGLGHGTNLHEELTHVPLLVRWPAGAVTGIAPTQVGHVDLAPTILRTLGVETDGGLPGTDLVDLLAGRSVDWGRSGHLLEHKNDRQKAVIVDGYRLLVHADRVEMTRTADGTETPLAAGSHPIAYALLRSRLVSLMHREGEAAPPAPEDVELDEEELSKLRALGYIMEGS
jgi:arylsulfatase